MFIKLTTVSDTAIYVNPDRIVGFIYDTEYNETSLWMGARTEVDSGSVFVKETPEQIMELINEHK